MTDETSEALQPHMSSIGQWLNCKRGLENYKKAFGNGDGDRIRREVKSLKIQKKEVIDEYFATSYKLPQVPDDIVSHINDKSITRKMISSLAKRIWLDMRNNQERTPPKDVLSGDKEVRLKIIGKLCEIHPALNSPDYLVKSLDDAAGEHIKVLPLTISFHAFN